MCRDLQKGTPSESEEVQIKKIILVTLRKYFDGDIINAPESLKAEIKQTAEETFRDITEEIYEQIYPESRGSE
jgi:hypothetical protein